MTSQSSVQPIAITPKELHIVQCLLRAYLPADSKVWAFGSRVNGTAKPSSDLDLAIDANERLPLGPMGSSDDSFTVAPFAYKVDLVDLHAITPEFRALIDAQKSPFPASSKDLPCPNAQTSNPS